MARTLKAKQVGANSANQNLAQFLKTNIGGKIKNTFLSEVLKQKYLARTLKTKIFGATFKNQKLPRILKTNFGANLIDKYLREIQKQIF